MATAVSPELVSRNPATGAELGRVATTPVEILPDRVATARAAQARWATTLWPARRAWLRRWWTILARDADAWADAVCAEVGKPRGEALAEVVTTLDALRWTIRHGGRALADEWIGPGWQRFLLVPSARLGWRPYGVVGIIGTWNYPLLLNVPAIAHAVVAGNGVIWKPSELAPLLGRKVVESLGEAGTPEGLVAAVFGGSDVGQALIDADIDKGFFTGGIANGRHVLETLAARGIPAVAELSGFDAAIVLPDAPLRSTARALAWAAFVGAGQTCVAVKRVYVVCDPASWADALAAHARTLRVGNPAHCDTDVGPLISATARERFDQAVRTAVEAGGRVLAGGGPIDGPGFFYAPTVLGADDEPPVNALAGCFGPVVVVRGVRDEEEAIAHVNASEFGLSASVWSRNHRAARSLARRLEVGMTAVNDAVAPSAHAGAPFGGIKASGNGRARGVIGLREFVQAQTIQARRAGCVRPQLYPYSSRMERALTIYRRLFHPGR